MRKINGVIHSYHKYDPDYAQNRYNEKRQDCHRASKFHQVKAFLAYFIEQFKKADYTSDVAVGVAKRHQLFFPEEAEKEPPNNREKTRKFWGKASKNDRLMSKTAQNLVTLKLIPLLENVKVQRLPY